MVDIEAFGWMQFSILHGVRRGSNGQTASPHANPDTTGVAQATSRQGHAAPRLALDFASEFQFQEHSDDDVGRERRLANEVVDVDG